MPAPASQVLSTCTSIGESWEFSSTKPTIDPRKQIMPV
jgi:hypothetical protein